MLTAPIQSGTKTVIDFAEVADCIGRLTVGIGVLLGSYLFLAAFLLFVAVVHFGVVLPEERYLQSLHGETYSQYKQSVRRWL